MVQAFTYLILVRDLQTGALRLEGKPKAGTYEWPKLHTSQSPSLSFASILKTTMTDWHSRLGHPAFSILQKVVSQFDLPISSNVLLAHPCNACSINKMHKLPFANSTLQTSHPLHVVFSDVWTSPMLSLDGFKYYVIFVDHFTRYTWLYPLKRKSDVFEVFRRFKVLVENQFRQKLRTLYTDSGGEYIGLASFLSSIGNFHMTSPPHTPEHNGVAECKHRHIVETGLALLSHASMPRTYWPFAFAAAVYLINRMPSQPLHFQNPYQSLHGQPPNFQKLRIFGCLCFPWLKPYTSHKLDARSKPCVFLGYSITQSAYFCLDRETSRVYTSRHVVFHESVFPFATPTSAISHKTTNELDPPVSTFPVVSVVPLAGTTPPAPPAPSDSTLQHQTAPEPPHQPVLQQQQAPPPNVARMPIATTSTETTIPPVATNLPSLEQQQASDQIRQPAPPPATQVLPPRRTSNRTPKPIQKLSLHTEVSPSPPTTIPTSVAEALKNPYWRKAMIDEINSQLQNRTWDLVNCPDITNVVGCRWVFTIKRRADGTIERYKARLVAKGYNQRPGIDYNYTFSPVVKPATIRLVLSTAVTRNWSLKQLDVTTAFLQGRLDDEVYMMQPTGFQDKDIPTAVCKLRKAIYGLKQAPRAWYNELRTFLLQSGFKNSLADASLFIFNNGGILLYMLVYVDDIIITGNSQQHITRFIASLSHRFSLKDLGDLTYFLGIECTRTASGLYLTQERYIADLLHRTNMKNAKSVATPLCSTSNLTLLTGTPLDDASEYRSVVGSLQYLSLTRPDISFSVNKMYQFMHRPTNEHWTAVKRILRYLSGTQNRGVFFHANNTPTLHAFTDADWAGNKDDYTSTGAYIVYMG
ncbi:hypothetical protein Bca101_088995 [Brassica carinata]